MGFKGVSAVAKREGVEIRLYSIIYELLDDIRNVMVGLLEPIVKQNVVGHAEVLQVFDLGKKGMAAGCRCADGRITSRCRARVKRKGDTLFEGALISLKRFQNDAAEVREGPPGEALDLLGPLPGECPRQVPLGQLPAAPREKAARAARALLRTVSDIWRTWAYCCCDSTYTGPMLLPGRIS